MTREEAIAELNKALDEISLGSYTYDGLERSIALEIGIKALEQEPKETWSIKDVATTFERHGLMTEQEPCEDAISRKDAINAIKRTVATEQIKELKRLPSVQPKPKTGHWIDHQEGRWIYAKCSECGTVHDTRTNYCPNCGAKMEREGKE